MNSAGNRSLRLATLLLAFLVAIPVTAKPIHPYSEPIALGNRAIDVGDVLETAFASTPWTLVASFAPTPGTPVQEREALYLGQLSYKGFDVQARIAVENNTLTLTLDSITETGCGNNCKKIDQKKALNWLVSLRRNIAYELTLRIRDSLQ